MHLQLWPSGTTVEYREVTSGSYQVADSATDGGWRPATPAEAQAIAVELTAQRLLDREVLCCDSALVTTLMRADGGGGDLGDAFSWDQVQNLYTDASDWDAEQCREWLTDHGHSHDADDDLDNLRERVEDNAEPAEVLEWWRVSAFLAEMLADCGEVVLDNEFGAWWGRCCSGQSVLMDGTLQAVAAKMHKITG